MSRNELIQIAKLKARPVMGTANHAHSQRPRGRLIRPKNLRAVDFLFAIQPHQARAHGGSGRRRRIQRSAGPCLYNRADDLPISRAAAEHAANRIHHFALAGREILFEQRSRGHQHPGRTSAALRGTVGEKGLLQAAVERRARRQALHGCNLTSRSLTRRHQAGADRLTIQQDGAGSAVARVTAHFCSRQPKIVAQNAGESPRPSHRHLNRAPVHRERNQIRPRRP